MTEDVRSTLLHTREISGGGLQQGSLDVSPQGNTHDQSRDTSEKVSLSDEGWIVPHILNGDLENMKNEIGILKYNIATMPRRSSLGSKGPLKWRLYWAMGSIFVAVLVCLVAIIYFKHLYDNERINHVHAKLQCKAKEDKIDVLESLRIKYESDLLVRDKELKTLRDEMLTSERHTRERLAAKDKSVENYKRSCENEKTEITEKNKKLRIEKEDLEGVKKRLNVTLMDMGSRIEDLSRQLGSCSKVKDQLSRTVDQMRADKMESEKRIHQLEQVAQKLQIQSARTGEDQYRHKAAKGLPCSLLMLMAPVIYTIMAGLY